MELLFTGAIRFLAAYPSVGLPSIEARRKILFDSSGLNYIRSARGLVNRDRCVCIPFVYYYGLS